MANEKNVTQKAEEAMKKQWSVNEIMGTLTEGQRLLLSYYMHISMQKGRIIGRMEKENKTAKDMSEVLHVDADIIQKALDEDPLEVIAK